MLTQFQSLHRRLFATTCLLLALSPAGHAAVSAEQAQTLHGALTPVGAERAGNRDGSIPPWTGGLTTGTRQDPFPGEQPILTITAANAASYAQKLPEGALALFRKYPDFRMSVFPTHRTAALPSRVYGCIFANATRALPAPEGIAYGVQNASGGIPFPIPHDGFEIIWNHLLSYWGTAREATLRTYVAGSDGNVDLTAKFHEITDFPYYYPDAPANFSSYYFKTMRIQDAPAAAADEAYVAWQPIDTARDRYIAWRILPGEHRVRKAPSLSYDTPDPDASGLEALDEYYLFFGGPDRYIFRNLGKREMYVPYNNNRLYGHDPRDMIGRHHENPDKLRYELHRVWVVEGILAPGKHHVAPRRRLYLDEDTWQVVYSDSWDEDGKLWKFGHATMYVMPDVPAVIIGTQFVYDLLLGGYAVDFVFDTGPETYKVTAPHAADTFSAQAMAARSVR